MNTKPESRKRKAEKISAFNFQLSTVLLLLLAIQCAGFAQPAYPQGTQPAAAPAAQTPQPVQPAAQPVIQGAPPATQVTTYNVRAGEVGPPTNTVEVVPLIVMEDTSLLDAIKNLARLANINIHFDPRVSTQTNQPTVTVRFENVTALDALNEVLDNYNLSLIYNPKTKISKVTIKDPKAEEPLFSNTFQLRYASPTNLMPILKYTLSNRSQVLADPRTSQLIVVTTQREMESVENLLAKLDTPNKQVLIEAHLLETAKNPKTVKGIDWSGTLQEQKFTFGNGTTVGESKTVIPGVPTTTTLPGGRTVTTSSKSSQVTATTTAIGGGGISANTLLGFSPATAFLNADGVKAVLGFLNQDNDTEVLSTPRTVTSDNQKAILSVTRAYPIFKITPGAANVPAGSEITYTNLGTILEVTPHIASDSNIALKVVPEVSNVDGIDKQAANGTIQTANIYAIRRMETHVLIPSGNTLVMGGLVSDARQKSFTKVPILGDLPVVGLAFRQDKKERNKSNLLIFVTPTIVEESDFQLANSDFMKTPLTRLPEPKETAWDSGKPKDWTKPVQ